jgi:hypothetical protein
MKTLMLTVFLLAASIGAANASHHARNRIAHNAWQANQSKPSKTTSGGCSVVQGGQAYLNACGEFIPSIYDPSPVSDY